MCIRNQKPKTNSYYLQSGMALFIIIMFKIVHRFVFLQQIKCNHAFIFFVQRMLLLVLAISSHSLFAQINPLNDNTQYTISKRFLSIEDGLASHEVFCGLQDKAGFLWFGTRNGLNRYDGKNCLLFTHQRNNLQDNKVVQLAQDDNNNLFIEYGSTGFQLTTNDKIDVMNAVTKEVKTLSAAFPNMPFKEQDVYWISNDGTDEINFLTAFPFRLWKYSSKNGFKLRYEIKDWNKNNGEPLVDYRSTGPFCMFAKGKALLKIFNQSTQYLISKDTVIAFIQKDALRSLPIGFNNQQDLLITYTTASNPNTFDIGMITNKGSSEFPAEVKQFNTDSIKGKYWYQAASSADGTACMFYLGTDALYLWNENAFLKIISKSEMKDFENVFIYHLFPDNFGNLWLCTSHGVLQLKIEKNRFNQYFTSKQQNAQPNSQARGIFADKNGKVVANIWMHTFMQRDDKIQYVTDYEIKYALIEHNAALYCGGYDLFQYDEKKNAISKYAGGQGSEIWSMFSLNDSLLLLGRTNGFSLFNSNTRKFDSLSTSNKNIPEAKFVYRFFKSNDDSLWAAAANGLYNVRIDCGRLTIVNCQSSIVNGLSLLGCLCRCKWNLLVCNQWRRVISLGPESEFVSAI